MYPSPLVSVGIQFIIHIHAYINIHVHACVYMCMHVYICVYIYIYIYIYVCMCVCVYIYIYIYIAEWDVAQSIACPPLKWSVVGSILLSGPSCSLGYFPFQPVVHNWFIIGRGMYCSVYGKVHIKDPLLLIEKSSLCGGCGFPSKKCVNVTI